MTKKYVDGNPKDKIGRQKTPFSTIPAPVIGELGIALLEGAVKYRRHNYRVAEVNASVYYDACLRHLTQWYEGEDIDPDSGLSHIIKAMACLTIIQDTMNQGTCNDDRPPKSTDQDWMKKLNEKTMALLARHEEHKEPYTEK